MWYFYIARCKDNSLYVGVTSSLSKRIATHNSGHGSSWIKQHGSAAIAYSEIFDHYLDARKREAQVKRWNRDKKERLIIGNI